MLPLSVSFRVGPIGVAVALGHVDALQAAVDEEVTRRVDAVTGKLRAASPVDHRRGCRR